MNKGSDNNSFRTFLISLFTSLVVGVLLIFMLAGYLSGNTPIENGPETEGDDIPAPRQLSFETGNNGFVAEKVAKTAVKGVVGLSVLKIRSNSIFDGNAAEKWGIGSGVIVSKNGYIITNNHVAGGENKRIIVSLADGREVEGTTVWNDSVLDLAVVKINADNLVSIPIGDADKLKVGEPAIAIGNPFGLQFQRTVTSGIVSALNRTIRVETDGRSNYMEDLIQTDAGINPGNSGGPLLNAKGQVVGINTIKVTSAEAIGFAVPINAVVPIIKHFTNDGEFAEPYMGIFAYDKEVIPFIDGSFNLDKGIYVAEVDLSGPAHKHGIKTGCIITRVDGRDINTMMQLRTYIYSKKPGDIIKVTHLNKETGKFETISIKLVARER